jgi:preprotein translocase subunit SecG
MTALSAAHFFGFGFGSERATQFSASNSSLAQTTHLLSRVWFGLCIIIAQMS